MRQYVFTYGPLCWPVTGCSSYLRTFDEPLAIFHFQAQKALEAPMSLNYISTCLELNFCLSQFVVATCPILAKMGEPIPTITVVAYCLIGLITAGFVTIQDSDDSYDDEDDFEDGLRRSFHFRRVR